MPSRNTVSIDGDNVVIVPRGLDKVWGFRRRITVARNNIDEVSVEQRPLRVRTGWRGPGLAALGKLVGTFHPRGERTYWNYSGRGPALVIHTKNRKPFDRLYLSVSDPDALRSQLNTAV